MAQAGLSWTTVLSKREHYRQVYDGFDPVLVAQYDEKKKEQLLENAGIIRNKLKIEASIVNARQLQNFRNRFKRYKLKKKKNKHYSRKFT